MTFMLPEGLSEKDEIELEWGIDGDRTMVTASLGDATIIVETGPRGAPIVPWLVASLPQLLETAWAELEGDEEETE